MILATEEKVLTERKLKESWFGPDGWQKRASQGKTAWSASILAKLSMLGKIPWHWSMIIYSSKALEGFLAWFWPIPTRSFPEQLLDMIWQLEHPRSNSSRQFASDNLLWRLKQFVRKHKRSPVSLGLIAWRYLWIYLICWCRCSHSETCSHM